MPSKAAVIDIPQEYRLSRIAVTWLENFCLIDVMQSLLSSANSSSYTKSNAAITIDHNTKRNNWLLGTILKSCNHSNPHVIGA